MGRQNTVYACAYMAPFLHLMIQFLIVCFLLTFFFFVTLIVKAVIRVMVTHKGRSVGNLSGNWPGKGLLLHKVLKHWSLRQDDFFQF